MYLLKVYNRTADGLVNHVTSIELPNLKRVYANIERFKNVYGTNAMFECYKMEYIGL